MLANLQRIVTLWLKEKTGLTVAVLIFGCVALVAAFMGFIFLCVSGYAWATVELGAVFGGLATAGVFLAIAAGCFAAAALSRRHAQHRAAPRRARTGRPQPQHVHAPKSEDAANRYAGKPQDWPTTTYSDRANWLSRNPVGSRTQARRDNLF